MTSGALFASAASFARALRPGIDAGDEVVFGEEPEAALPVGIDEIVAGPEVADTADVLVLHVPLDHRLGVGLGEMDLGDNALRVAELVGHFLEPSGLVDRVGRADRRLDVDRLRHVREADLGDVVLDVVLRRLDRVDRPEHRMRRVALEPAIAERRVHHGVQVEMRVDERDRRHLAPSPRCGPPPGRRIITQAQRLRAPTPPPRPRSASTPCRPCPASAPSGSRARARSPRRCPSPASA